MFLILSLTLFFAFPAILLELRVDFLLTGRGGFLFAFPALYFAFFPFEQQCERMEGSRPKLYIIITTAVTSMTTASVPRTNTTSVVVFSSLFFEALLVVCSLQDDLIP